MHVSNFERLNRGLALFVEGFGPFAARELQAHNGTRGGVAAPRTDIEDKERTEPLIWSPTELLQTISRRWDDVFSTKLSQQDRVLVSELIELCGRLSKSSPFSTDDTYRALDSIHRLLQSVSAQQAREVDRQRQELLRVRFDEQARKEALRSTSVPLAGQPQEGLKPWRQVVTPHADVASGRYQKAEFAADLGQVFRGEGAPEYLAPKDFFQRTHFTEGLKALLSLALRRLSGAGGDPVVELQTNFGGGKTHALLALYHLFSGKAVTEMLGVEEILHQEALTEVPKIRRVVLVGRDISPGQPRKKSDGTVVRTLWGELAWQLGGKEGFDLVAEADRTGTSPGDALVSLFRKFGPCLILVDEWVVYARQLYRIEGLPGGTLETQFSFAQALTDSAKAVDRTLVVLSIPASDIEIGGEGGRVALDGLRQVIGRVQTPWRPASSDESFEIVRRRLFEPLNGPSAFRERDAVVRAFVEFYRAHTSEFPPDVREAAYERRLKNAYPIHPELFDRLYEDWSALEKFQRTRGVLRLMAAVIHVLWERQDGSLIITPSAIPIDESRVQFELTTYLEDNWPPVIDADVDGPNSLPLRLDRENPNLGRFSASRRVARSIYLGSAPTTRSSHRGIEEKRIKLACVQPGESPGVFSDALRRLSDQATHLYVDGARYWFGTQTTVTRLAQDRSSLIPEDVVDRTITELLREISGRGDFDAVHVSPASSIDVGDDPEARLVILPPTRPRSARDPADDAHSAAADILGMRGDDTRNNKNALVFLAADKSRLRDLRLSIQTALAWKSVVDERESLNLDSFQTRLATAKLDEAEHAVRARLPEVYCWLIVPQQASPNDPIDWIETRLQGQDGLAARASKKLRNDELLITELAGTRLRHEMDKVPLWRGNLVRVKELADDFARYLYLPRLRDSDVLLSAIRNGLTALTWQTETFAYADKFDEMRARFIGLRGGSSTGVRLDGESILVKPEIALSQLETGGPENLFRPGSASSELAGMAVSASPPEGVGSSVTPREIRGPRRFYGVIDLDANRVGRDLTRIIEEVLQHLQSQPGATIELTLEVSAKLPEGAPASLVRTVTENSKALRFKSHGFEEK